MSLLREIQHDAVESSLDLETLLRRCLILAVRLKHDEFRAWVKSELDGYQPGTKVPEYRKFRGECYGHFSGPFQSGLRNAPIPKSLIPKEHRQNLTNRDLRHSVSALRELAAGCEDGSLKFQWPADVSVAFGAEIYERMILVQGWMLIPKSTIVGILSTVRNRILNFALEIEASNPDAGEAPQNTTPVPRELVSQMFNTYIHGNVGNVAAGQHINQLADVDVRQGDFESLAAFLESQGVENSEIQSLQEAVKEDPMPSGKRFGAKVSVWMGTMVKKSAEGTWKIATTVASNLLTSAIKSYYGI